MEIYKVFTVEGRENNSGQPAECLVGVNMELAFDTKHIKSDMPIAGKAHQARVKLVSFKDKTAFELGKKIDGAMTEYVDIDITQNETLVTLFEQAMAVMMSMIAEKIGGDVEDAEFDD